MATHHVVTCDVEHPGQTHERWLESPMSARDRDARGFRRFMSRTRSPEEVLYGASGEVRVHESSLAGRGAHVWIRDPIGSAQLNVEEARMLRRALDTFIAEAEAGELTEPT